MCGPSSKSVVKFNENLSELDYKELYLNGYHTWTTLYVVREDLVIVKIWENSYPPHEFIYQICLVPCVGRTEVIRGVGSSNNHETHIHTTKLCRFAHWKCYSHINFQAEIYVFIDENEIRNWNFKHKNIYGKSEKVDVEGGYLNIPIESIAKRAPLLAVRIQKHNFCKFSKNDLDCFLQILHGVQVQLKRHQFKLVLKLAVKYEVFNVKRYCEQQLIRRDDLGFSNLQKYEMAKKFNLIHLMRHVLDDIETIEELVECTKKKVDWKQMDMGIAKSIFRNMYELN